MRGDGGGEEGAWPGAAGRASPPPFAHVVDDEPTARLAALRALAGAGFGTEGHASGDAFLATAGAPPGLRFGCVLLDLRLPGTDGLGVMREMAARGLALPVVVVTAHADVRTAVRAMQAGATDLLEKPCRPRDLVDAAKAALARGGEAAARVASLTPREREVLRGLVAGRQNKVIAKELGLSHRTVEIHRANAMARLGARSLPEAVRTALLAGLRPPPGGGGVA